MVWLKVITLLFILTASLNANNLNEEELSYFQIIDLNNDGFVSYEEINQSINIIFQLIDLNKERSIDVIITRLRKKIEINPKNPKFLQTIRGAGYVLWIEWIFKKDITKKIIL